MCLVLLTNTICVPFFHRVVILARRDIFANIENPIHKLIYQYHSARTIILDSENPHFD